MSQFNIDSLIKKAKKIDEHCSVVYHPIKFRAAPLPINAELSFSFPIIINGEARILAIEVCQFNNDKTSIKFILFDTGSLFGTPISIENIIQNFPDFLKTHVLYHLNDFKEISPDSYRYFTNFDFLDSLLNSISQAA